MIVCCAKLVCVQLLVLYLTFFPKRGRLEYFLKAFFLGKSVFCLYILIKFIFLWQLLVENTSISASVKMPTESELFLLYVTIRSAAANQSVDHFLQLNTASRVISEKDH